MRRRARRRPRAGFTLVELMVVIVIIGIILALILTAAFSGLQAANTAGTRALIAKLDAAVADRLDALMNAFPTVTGVYTPVAGFPNLPGNPTPGTHQSLASIPNGANAPPLPGFQRAYTIARADFLRAEMPDAFVIDTSDATYPVKYPGPTPGGTSPTTVPYGAVGTQISGVNGASFNAAAGITRNLGNLPNGTNVVEPTGYNGIDDNADGNVDELAEWTLITPANATLITANMAAHTHKTARSEMLYAMLTEGIGPFGSAFSKDDFTDREVRDTDGDGLPEFVDTWGEPLQFYRWPLYYGSDIQKGFAPYADLFEQRERNPIDQNQQLVAPAWFAGQTGTPTGTGPGANAQSFQGMFFTLVDPQTNGATAPNLWDRSALYTRRAYKWRPLIISSGPDKLLGVGQLGFDYTQYASSTSGGTADALVPVTAPNIIGVEGLAAEASPYRAGNIETPNATSDTSLLIQGWGLDDVNNQTYTSAGGAR